MDARAAILVVDDDGTSRELVGYVLADAGYRVRTAEGGEAALAAVAAEAPDLVLLDVRMSDLDGFEVCRRLQAREETRGIAVIFLTGANEVADRVAGLDLGAVDYLVKPFQRDELLARVRTHLELRRLRAEARRREVELARTAARLEAEISERDRAERFRALFDRSRDAVYVHDFEGHFLEANDAALRMIGLEREGLGSVTFQSLLAPEELAAAVTAVAEIRETGSQREPVELRLCRTDGRVICVQAQGFAVYDAGRPVAVLGIARDVTEQTRELEVRAALAALTRPLLDPRATIADFTCEVLAHARRLTGSAHGCVASIDAESGTLVAHTLTPGMPGCRSDDGGQGLVLPRGPDGRYAGLWGHALNERVGFFVNDPASYRAVAGSPSGSAPFERYMAVPALAGGLTVGIIALASPGRDYGARDLEAVGRLAEVLALAVGRTRSDTALRESERRFRDILETIQLAAVTLDDQGRITFCNDYLASLLERPRHELIGRDWFALAVPDAEREQVREIFVRTLVTGTFPAHYVNDVITRGGERRTIAWNNTVLRTPAGVVVGSTSIGEDITERIAIERALRESEQRYRTLTSQAPVGIFQIDREGNLVFANGRWYEMLGLTPEQAAGRAWQRSMHPDDEPRVDESWRRAMAQGSEFELEHRVRTPAGKVSWVLGHAVPLRDGSGAVTGTLGFMTDITEQREMQARLLQAGRMASVGTLAAGVAHEINNPLAYVVANLGYAVDELRAAPLGGGAPVGDVLEALTEAQEGAERVRRIVRDLRVFSRADEERLTMVAVEPLLDSSISMAANEIRHRAQLVREYGGVPDVRANDARLGQVFLNLLINAAQSIPEGHADRNQVRVRTGVDGAGRVCVEIGDTGAGIAPELVPRIFDPFFTTKPVGVGTGLGLAICQGVVMGLGGEIQVQSEVGVGSTFRVVLPVGAPPAAETAVAGPAPPQVRRARVLVVDDEELVGRAVRRMLAPHHEVVLEVKAADALRRLVVGERFDVVICDLMMPEMTGMDLHREVVERVPEMAPRIVFLTGGAFTPGAREFLARVPNLKLEKPLSPAALAEAVARVIS